MGRVISLAALLLSLAACAHDDVTVPPPLAKPDPRLCAPIEAPPSIQGGIVQPVTQEQADAVTEFLRGEADLWFWGNRGWGRASLAKDQLCR